MKGIKSQDVFLLTDIGTSDGRLDASTRTVFRFPLLMQLYTQVETQCLEIENTKQMRKA